MTQFKVGDKVRRIHSHWGDIKKGDVGVVTYVEGNGLRLEGHEGHDRLYATDRFELVKEEPKRHPFADVIIAWANGAKVQTRLWNAVSEVWSEWFDDAHPTWMGFGSKAEHRIKPEKKPDVVRYGRIDKPACGDLYSVPVTHVTKSRAQTDNVKATFDGETGKLKAVELLSE